MKRLSFLKRLAAASAHRKSKLKSNRRSKALLFERLDSRQVMDGAAPTLESIATQTVLAGAPLVIPLNASDTDSGPLTFSVTNVSNNNLTVTTPDGNLATKNRSLKLSVAGYGDMYFQLFEDKAPGITSKIIDIVNSGAWNNTIFHRLISGFMVQGGGTKANNAGQVTGFSAFDDQFNVDLMHTSSGLLSMAKTAADDSNTNEFFITDVTTRFLDFNHSVFGKLVKGDDVRNAIMAVDETGGGGVDTSNDRPLTDIVITSASIYTDDDNGVLFLKAPEGVTGTATVTVRVTDSDGNFADRTFTVNIAADTDPSANSQPFLNPLPAISTTTGSNAVFQLTSTDREGNAVNYFALKPSDETVAYTFTQVNGLVTITPPANFIGTLKIKVGVSSLASPNSFANPFVTPADPIDTQVLTVTVRPAQPGLALAAASDSGIASNDGITNAQNLQFSLSGLTTGATVDLYNGDNLIETFTAAATTANITTTAFDLSVNGTYNVRVTQTVNGVVSVAGTYSLKLDRTGPVDITPAPPTEAVATRAYVYDAQHPEEGTDGFRYSLTNNPSNMTIDATSGVITWTPTADQVGALTFGIVAKDAAGNQKAKSVNVTISESPLVQLTLKVTDSNGVEISSIANGQQFELRVYTNDVVAGQSGGVYSAYLDVEYDALLADVLGTITYGDAYQSIKSGNTSTPGLLDEMGAAQGLTRVNGELLLFKQKFTAKKSGVLTFDGNESDSDLLDTLRNSPTSVFPKSRIEFVSASVTIDPSVTAVTDTFNVDEDSTSTTLDPIANDSVTSGTLAGLIITEVSTGDHGGTLVKSQDGKTVIYTPAANFNGAEHFTYTVKNTDDSTSVGNITIQVQPKNDAPNAVDDPNMPATEGGLNLFVNVLLNDTKGNDSGDASEVLRIVDVTATGSHGGKMVIANLGTHLVYTPAPGFTGEETFTYTIADRDAGDSTRLTDTATVTMKVNNQNSQPVAGNDSVEVAEDSAVTNFSGLLTNDNGGANDTGETLTIVSVTDVPAGFTVTIASDNKSINFTPKPNFQGLTSFKYTMTDGNGGQAIATVNVTVTNVNDNPTANNDSPTASKDQANQVLNVLANDSSEPDPAENLTITGKGTPDHGGTITISSDNKSILYTPAAGFTGTETFTYTISDGNGGTAQATVSVNVLDFVPSKITGRVYFDANGDSKKQGTENGIGNIQIHLEGTSEFDADGVSVTVTTDSQGRYTFDLLPPGTYTITQLTMNGLTDTRYRVGTQGGSASSNGILVSLTQGVESLYNDFMYAAPRSVGIFSTSLLASAARSGFVAAAKAGSNGYAWNSIGQGWASYSDLKLNLASDLKSVTITGNDDGLSTASTKSATLQLTNAGRIRAIQKVGDTYTFQVNGTPSQIFGTTSGSGEPGSRTNTRTAGTASGESGSSNLTAADAALLAVTANNNSSSTANFVAKTRSMTQSSRIADLLFASSSR